MSNAHNAVGGIEMTKEWQERFYGAIRDKIEEVMREKNLTVHALATKSGQQYTTIRRILEGRGFSFHHVVWLTDILEISMDEWLIDLHQLTRVEARVDAQIKKNQIQMRRHTYGKSIEEEIDSLI